MSVMGFFEPAAAPGGGLRLTRDGLGAGIQGIGPVLEGRLTVEQAFAIAGVRCVGGNANGSTMASWNQTEIDALWAQRDSIFG